jgi:hypothetical protein
MKIPSFNHAGIFAMTASVLVLGLNGCADNVGSSEHSHQRVGRCRWQRDWPKHR